MKAVAAWVRSIEFTDEQRRILTSAGFDAAASEALRQTLETQVASHAIDRQLATSGEVREQLQALQRTAFELATQLSAADPRTLTLARPLLAEAFGLPNLPHDIDLRVFGLWSALGQAAREQPAQGTRTAWVEAVHEVAAHCERAGIAVGRGKRFRSVCEVAFDAMQIPAGPEHSIREYLRKRGEKLP